MLDFSQNVTAIFKNYSQITKYLRIFYSTDTADISLCQSLHSQLRRLHFYPIATKYELTENMIMTHMQTIRTATKGHRNL